MHVHIYILVSCLNNLVKLLFSLLKPLLISLPGAWNYFQGPFIQGLSGVDLSFSRRLRDGWLWPW